MQREEISIAGSAECREHLVLLVLGDMHITPCVRALQRQSLYQGPARCALEAYVPRLITSPSSWITP
jgi:hypothetical protein